MQHTDTPTDDLSAAQTPRSAQSAGGALMATGLLTCVSGVQLWGFVLRDWIVVVPYVQLTLGLAAICFGFFACRGRDWGAIGGMVVACLVLLQSLSWSVVGFAFGFVSLFGLVTPALALASVVLLALAIGPARRVSAARRRLAQEGLDLGV